MDQLTYEECLQMLFDETQDIKWREFALLRIFRRTRHGITELQALRGVGRVGRAASKALDSLRASFDTVNLPKTRPPTPPANGHARALATLRDSTSSAEAQEDAIDAIVPALEAGIDALRRARGLPDPFAANSKIALPRISEALGR